MNILKSIAAAITTLVLGTLIVSGQAKKPYVSGYLIKDDGKYNRVLVSGSDSKRKLYYKENKKATVTKKASISSFSGIWLFEPKDVTEAKDLYEARKYKEAKDAFIDLQKRYKAFQFLDDNYVELSKFYEMECYRKLKDYKTLAKELELYKPSYLTRPGIIQQTKLYKMYDAVHKKDWKRLHTLCLEYVDYPLSLGQRAQVAFCHGLAYEGLGKTNEALNAYATAMTSDFTRSESIVREAALNSLRIFNKDEEIHIAMRLWKTPDEEKNKSGYKKLTEANGLARLYEKAGLGSGVPLPSKYKKFQKYTSDETLKMLEKREARAQEVQAAKKKDDKTKNKGKSEVKAKSKAKAKAK